MKRGEIWMVEIPRLGGHEQQGRRPAIIMADTKTSVVIIIPCTSNLQALRFPYTLRLASSKTNGLQKTSIALILQVRAIDKRRLEKRIGKLEQQSLKKINSILKKLFVLG